MFAPIQQSLAGIEILADLEPAERQAVERLCRWKRCAAQEQIFDRQSASRDVYFVVDGRVRVVIYSISGREVTFDDVAAGNVVGELAALDGQPRSASVLALVPSMIAAMPPDSFRELLAYHPEVSQSLLRRMAQVIRMATERILDLSTMAANNRVHAEVLRFARAAMTGPNEAQLKPIPVHGDIAARVSTTRETVARVLSNLTRYGLVRRTKDALFVTDVRKLGLMVSEIRGEEAIAERPLPPVIRVTVRRPAPAG